MECVYVVASLCVPHVGSCLWGHQFGKEVGIRRPMQLDQELEHRRTGV